MIHKPSLFFNLPFEKSMCLSIIRDYANAVSAPTETVQKQSADADLQRQHEVIMMLI